MPEFTLDYGTADAFERFKRLDTFAQGYVEAMFFTSTGTSDDGDLDNANVAEMADETFDKIEADCRAFNLKADAWLRKAYLRDSDYDETKAGRDFWYSRNGHGTGFWDRGLGAAGDKLHSLAGNHEINLYRGDDGKLYLD